MVSSAGTFIYYAQLSIFRISRAVESQKLKRFVDYLISLPGDIPGLYHAVADSYVIIFLLSSFDGPIFPISSFNSDIAYIQILVSFTQDRVDWIVEGDGENEKHAVFVRLSMKLPGVFEPLVLHFRIIPMMFESLIE